MPLNDSLWIIGTLLFCLAPIGVTCLLIRRAGQGR